MSRFTPSHALLLISGLAAGPVFAQSTSSTSQGYVGLAGGASQYDAACTAGFSCDKNHGALKLYGGYQLAPDWSGELTYYSLGRFKSATTAGGLATAADVKGSYWGLGAAWRPQLGGPWGAVGRFGAAYVAGTVDPSGFGEQTRHTWQPYAGLGVSYALAPNTRLEADYDITRLATRYTDPTTGSSVGHTGNLGSFMLGATVGF